MAKKAEQKLFCVNCCNRLNRAGSLTAIFLFYQLIVLQEQPFQNYL